jgi:hypothetical protein
MAGKFRVIWLGWKMKLELLESAKIISLMLRNGSGKPMARYLAVGDVYDENWCDLRIFYSNTDTEFLNTGRNQKKLGLQKRSTWEILGDVRRNGFEMVIAGSSGFPHFNPRKNILRNCTKLIWKVLCHPNLITGRLFPFLKLSVPMIGMDMSDSTVIDNSRFRTLAKCVCFFKRELPQNQSNAFLYTTAKTENSCNVTNIGFFQNSIKKLRPISLGIDNAIAAEYAAFSNAAKKTDVFFAGKLANRLNRQSGLKQLERLKAEGYSIDIAPEALPLDEFLRRCAQAHIVWSPEGNGWDCFRHYEAAVVGSVPLMQSPTIHRYAPFLDNEHGIYYYLEGDHLAFRVRQALQNRARLIEMGQAARMHVLRWHTYEALGRYVIEEARRTLSETSDA